MKCVLLIIFLVQNIFTRSWKFKKYRKYDKTQNEKWNKYKSIYQIQEVAKCYLFFIFIPS